MQRKKPKETKTESFAPVPMPLSSRLSSPKQCPYLSFWFIDQLPHLTKSQLIYIYVKPVHNGRGNNPTAEICIELRGRGLLGCVAITDLNING